jgi:ABC-type Fe3+-citrate transport system substrate-binding protein
LGGTESENIGAIYTQEKERGKDTEMPGKLQRKKQVINEYWLNVGKAEQEIVELNES